MLTLSAAQYNIVMHTCQDTASVKRVLRQMEEAGVSYDAATFMTVFNVFARSADYDKAVKVLQAAEQEGVMDARRVDKTLRNLHRRLRRQNAEGARALKAAMAERRSAEG